MQKIMKYEKSCGAIILREVDKQYKVLLINHVNGGHWSFPKGHVENNETEEQTALREIKEETGLRVILDTGFRYINTYSPKENVIKDVVYFLGFTEDCELKRQVEEVNEAGWFTLDEAPNIITHDSDKRIFLAAREYLMTHGF